VSTVEDLVTRHPNLRAAHQPRITYLQQILDADPASRAAIHERMVRLVPRIHLPKQPAPRNAMTFTLRNTVGALPDAPLPPRRSAMGNGLLAGARASLRRATALARNLRNNTSDILLIGGSLADGWRDDFWDPCTVLRVTGQRPEDLVRLLKTLPRN